jgi:hypothetical protein
VTDEHTSYMGDVYRSVAYNPEGNEGKRSFRKSKRRREDNIYSPFGYKPDINNISPSKRYPYAIICCNWYIVDMCLQAV